MRQHNPRKLRQPRARLQNYTPSSKAKICTCSEAYILNASANASFGMNFRSSILNRNNKKAGLVKVHDLNFNSSSAPGEYNSVGKQVTHDKPEMIYIGVNIYIRLEIVSNDSKPPSKYIFWLSKMGYSFAVLPLVVLIFLGYVVSFNSVRIDSGFHSILFFGRQRFKAEVAWRAA